MFSKEKNLETILAIVLGLLVIFLLTKFKVLVSISVVLLFIPIVSQKISGWITWGWMKLAHVMGFVMSKLLLSVIFYFVLFPIALLSRIGRKSVLNLKKSNNGSYYSERNHKYSSADLENPW